MRVVLLLAVLVSACGESPAPPPGDPTGGSSSPDDKPQPTRPSLAQGDLTAAQIVTHLTALEKDPAAVDELAARGKAVGPHLLEAVRTGPQGPMRARIIEVLVKLGADALPTIRTGLGDKDPVVRMISANAASRLRDTAKPLLDQLRPLAAGDPDSRVRSMAEGAVKFITGDTSDLDRLRRQTPDGR